MPYTYDRTASLAPSVEELQQRLDELDELSDNLGGIEDAFSSHFNLTASVLSPEVTSQFEVLKKSREGLKAAEEIQKQAALIISLHPDDKTAARTKLEADRMVKRFSDHADAAHKIIRTLAKKEMPPALKKEAAVAERLLRSRLVNDDSLKVIPWQGEKEIWLPGRGGVGTQVVKVIQYQMVFRFSGLESRFGNTDFLLTENTGDAQPGVRSYINTREVVTTGKTFAEAVCEQLEGWTGIKGQFEAIQGRAEVAQQVEAALKRALDRLEEWGQDPTRISPDNKTIEGAYRSGLPKEGAYSVGEYEYGRMLDAEYARCHKVLDPLLAALMGSIKEVRVHSGEKSWIYIEVILK